MRVGYARVSTDHQSADLQRDALKAAGCDLIFEDVISGATRKRPGLADALSATGPGDQLVVWRLDRLGRSLGHLIAISAELRGKGAHLLSITENIDTSSSVGDLFFHIVGAIAEFERHLIVERTVAGLEAARARGARLGRRRLLTPAQIRQARNRLSRGEKAEAIASDLKISRATLFRRVKERPPFGGAGP